MKLLLGALAGSALTAWLLTAQGPAQHLKLDNARIRVTEWVYRPGEPRAPYIRPTDQLIVFLDDARYERKVTQTGAIEIRERKAGDVLWHDQGEEAPQLTAQGRPYRTLVIEFKESRPPRP